MFKNYLILFITIFISPFVHANSNGNFYELTLDDFESYNVGDTWSDLSAISVINNCGLDNDSSNQCIRVAHIPSSNGTPWLIHTEKLPGSTHTVLSYDLYYEEGFEFVYGGKMPGLTSRVPGTGCNTIVKDSWSARPMWRGSGHLQPYYYSQDRSNSCGDGFISEEFKFVPGQWYHLELNVKLNSEPDKFDGHVIIKINDEVAVANYNVRFRAEINSDSLISLWYFDSFFGGNSSAWSPSKTVYARYDNFKILTMLSDDEATNLQGQFPGLKYAITPKAPTAPVLKIVEDDSDSSLPALPEFPFSELPKGIIPVADWKSIMPEHTILSGISEERISRNQHTTEGLSDNHIEVKIPAYTKSLRTNGIRWEVPLKQELSNACINYEFKFSENLPFASKGVLPGLSSKNGSDATLNWKTNLMWWQDGRLSLEVINHTGTTRYDIGLNNHEATITPGDWTKINLCYVVGPTDDYVELKWNDLKAQPISRINLAGNIGERSGPINFAMLNIYFYMYSVRADIVEDAYIYLQNLSLETR